MTELDLILAVESAFDWESEPAYGVAEGIFDDVIETLRKRPTVPAPDAHRIRSAVRKPCKRNP